MWLFLMIQELVIRDTMPKVTCKPLKNLANEEIVTPKAALLGESSHLPSLTSTENSSASSPNMDNVCLVPCLLDFSTFPDLEFHNYLNVQTQPEANGRVKRSQISVCTRNPFWPKKKKNKKLSNSLNSSKSLTATRLCSPFEDKRWT